MSVTVIDNVRSYFRSGAAKMPFWIWTSRAQSARYSETPKKFAAKFLDLVSKSEFWFYHQMKVGYLLSAPLNHKIVRFLFISFCLSDSSVFSVLH